MLKRLSQYDNDYRRVQLLSGRTYFMLPSRALLNRWSPDFIILSIILKRKDSSIKRKREVRK